MDYAKESNNRRIVDLILKGIYNYEYLDITEITRNMNLKSFIEEYSPEIIPILKDKIVIKPEVQSLGGQIKIPNIYDYDDNQTLFAFTSIPSYTKYCQ